MRTVSLRWRAVASSLVVLAVLLVGVGAAVGEGLGRQLASDQRSSLLALASRGSALAPRLGDRALADRLSAPGVTATVTRRQADGTTTSVSGVPSSSGDEAAGRALRAGAGRARRGVRVAVSGARVVLTERLGPRRTLRLSADRGSVRDAQRRYLLLAAAAGLAGLCVAGGLLWWVLGRALRPLDAMTATARAIAAGDRGRRLAPDRPGTELGRTAAAFDAMLEELEGAERRAQAARDDLARFLSDASHELRTPLAGIAASAELLLLDDDGRGEDGDAGGGRVPSAADAARARRERVAADVVREAHRAGRLVGDLLAASRAEEVAGAVEDVGVAELVAASVARPTTRPDAPEVEVALAGGSTPAVVRGDPQRLEQVLVNLLDNARRAAPGGRVRVRVEPGGGRVRVRVSDSGPGVPPADRERVFERLVRLDAARTRADGGAGLGLAIARGLARAHGGTLTCTDPAPGDLPGAVFVLDLPAALPPWS